MAYFTRREYSSSSSSKSPFAVVPWTGSETGNYYMVTSGVAFSSFSFDTGTFIPIKGMNEKIDLQSNNKIYLDATVLPNLQISNITIKCGKVGVDAGAIDNPISPSVWYNYPNMCYIQPGDKLDSKGRVIQLVDGKRQYKSYLLMAYRSDDTSKNGTTTTQGANSQSGNFSVVQVLNSDIIYMTSQVSGVPVVFPMPYFNGAAHLGAANNG